VKLSVKSDYAARAVFGLARHYQSGVAQRVDILAEEQSIPPKFLVQILIELKSRGIVRSLRGKQGGYLLARPPAEITMGDILRCIHGQIIDVNVLRDNQCPLELQHAWSQMQNSLEKAADAINFQHLLEAAGDKQRMYYI
jgi:Rrf2 family protein